MKFSLLFCTYIFSFFYILFLSVLYFSKKRLDNVENKIYRKLLITNFWGIIIQILSELTSILRIEILNCIMTKMLLLYFIFWIILFFMYVLEISNVNNKRILIFNYVYYDINKDGNNELIVVFSSPSAQYHIAEIYTYDGNKASMFIPQQGCLGERCSATLYDNGIIYFYGAGGARVHGLTFYKIGDNGYSIEIVKDYGVEIDENGNYTISEGDTVTSYKSDEEAINSVVGNAKKVDMTKLDWKEIK